MKIGARTLKSGIAILISLILPNLLGIPDATVLSGISSLASLQPSVKGSWDKFIQRLSANTIGGILAIVMAYFLGNSYIIIAISSIVLIAILHALHLDKVIDLAAMTLIIIMLNQTDTIVTSAIIRVAGTFIGVTVSFVVNRLIMPPKYDERLFKSISLQTDELAKLLRSALRKNNYRQYVKDDLKTLHSNQAKMETLFTHMTEEAHFTLHRLNKDKNREYVYQQTRLLIVFRQFLQVNKVFIELLEAFNNHENTYNHLPDTLRILTRERLETLITAHEQIISKFSGKISAEEVKFFEYKVSLHEQFINEYFGVAKSELKETGNDSASSNGVIHLMSAIFAYDEEVTKLNRLVRNYRTTHGAVRHEFKEEIDIE